MPIATKPQSDIKPNTKTEILNTAAIPPLPEPERFRILIIGAGPAGLILAFLIKQLFADTAEVTVCDGRLKKVPGGYAWKGARDGINRRNQVVTLQSNVIFSLPAVLRRQLAAVGKPAKIWAMGGDSPPEHGAPWNLSIRDIEDALLGAAQETGVRFQARKVDPAHIDFNAYDFVAIADGSQSRTRSFFQPAFGQADETAFALNGQIVEDTILGLKVTSQISDANAVALTIAQQRFLMNTKGGEGYLYMRLTEEEAREVRGIRDGAPKPSACTQGDPAYLCKAAGDKLRFGPAEDPNSFLWPRVREGLKLFGVEEADLHSVTSFKLSMVRRGRFTAEITPMGAEHPVIAGLIGDSGLNIHFWPGRGMNAAILSAMSLARTIEKSWRGRPLRSADFTTHEAAMAALQHRHQDRAWRNMVTPRKGEVVTYANAFADILEEPSVDKQASIGIMHQRLLRITSGLQPRMSSQFDVEDISARLRALSPATLHLFAECGGWETWMSGGPEVDLDLINPAAVSDTTNRAA